MPRVKVIRTIEYEGEQDWIIHTMKNNKIELHRPLVVSQGTVREVSRVEWPSEEQS